MLGIKARRHRETGDGEAGRQVAHRHEVILLREKKNWIKSKVADPDPGFGAFLSLKPGSLIGFFRILDIGSQTHIFDSLMTNFWVKSTIILRVLAENFVYLFIISSFMIFVATKNGRIRDG